MDIAKLKDLLPKHPQILGRDKYTNSAVLIPIVLIENEYHILFQKRSKNIPQGDDICFPGGKYEDSDRNFKNTAIREFQEELGIDKANINILGPLNIVVAAMGVIVEPFVGIIKIDSIQDIKYNREEVESVFIIPVNYFIKNKPEIYNVKVEIKTSYTDSKGNLITLLPVKQLNISENYLKPWGKKKEVLVYQTNYGTIWGLTAEIIEDFVKIITL